MSEWKRMQEAIEILSDAWDALSAERPDTPELRQFRLEVYAVRTSARFAYQDSGLLCLTL